MTTVNRNPVFDFTLDAAHEAHEPPEARGLRRDGVRLLVSAGDDDPVDARFTDLPRVLRPGDLLVVNTSATVPAAFDGRLPDGEPIVVHLSGALPGDVWLVEVRRPRDGATEPLHLDRAVDVALLAGGSRAPAHTVRELGAAVARPSRRRDCRARLRVRARAAHPLPARAA